MSATRPDPTEPLVGTHVRLDPMTHDDIPALFEAVGRHPEVFAGGWGGGPAGYRQDLADFAEFAKKWFAWGHSNVYAVRAPDGELIGTTTLGDFEEAAEHAHLGWTAFTPSVWGTAVNPESKLLLLGSAFDHGFGRVKIQADVRNGRSRAAILRLGASFEGVVRRDRLRADGTWRDSAVYSIIIDEWPTVKAGLQRRVALFG